MALDDDMTTPPTQPDGGTPADAASGSISRDDYLGRDGGADGDASVADAGADGGAGDDDPTTETEEDPRLA